MSITGTIIDGQVKLDGPMQWPDGTPVRLTQRRDRPSPCDEAAELAGLHEAMDDVRAGRVYPAEQVLREMATRHNLSYTVAD